MSEKGHFDKKEVKEMLNNIDQNDDGVISKEELKKHLSSIFH